MIFLQAAAATAQQPSAWSSWGMIILLIVIFYFFMIRPQQKRQKETRKFRDSLTKGSKVITAGGIYGTIVEISGQNTSVLLEIAPGVKIRIEKTMIYPSTADAQSDMANVVNESQK
jgi:preprotein translocase subunit YajC